MNRLAILDLCRSFSREPSGVLADTLELGRVAERLGFSRYWIAEHHVPGVAHNSPELLLAALGATTTTIRLGSAGVLLKYRNPYKVLLDFSLLATLYPGRIDLGVARGGVSDAAVAALLRGAGTADYDAHVRQLFALAAPGSMQGVLHRACTLPDIWMLGTNRVSMELAATYGAAFCLALFLEPAPPDPEAIILEYQDRFASAGLLPRPTWSIAVAGACAASAAVAHQTVAAFGAGVRPSVVGAVDTCDGALQDLRTRFGCEEIVFLEMAQSIDDRRRSFELLAGTLATQ